MQAASRMADGQWPWRDFGWAYGPGQPLACALGASGDSLLSWRLLRVGADATAAVLVWALVRDLRPRWALRRGSRRRSPPRSRPARTRPPRPWPSRSAPCCAPRGAAPAWAGGFGGARRVLAPGRGRDRGAGRRAAAVAWARPRARSARRDAGGDGARRRRQARRRGERGGVRPRTPDRTLSTAPPARWARALVVSASPRSPGSCSTRRSSSRPGRARVGRARRAGARATGSSGGCRSRTGSAGATRRTSWRGCAPYRGAGGRRAARSSGGRRSGWSCSGRARRSTSCRGRTSSTRRALLVVAAAARGARPAAGSSGRRCSPLLIAVGSANRARRRCSRPPELEPFELVRVPPAEADALPQADRRLSSELVPPGEPIYVAPLRTTS